MGDGGGDGGIGFTLFIGGAGFLPSFVGTERLMLLGFELFDITTSLFLSLGDGGSGGAGFS